MARGSKAGKGRQPSPEAQARVERLLGGEALRRDRLLEYLHVIQDSEGHLSAANLVALAQMMKLTPVEVYEVASFYHHFDVVREGERPPPPLTVRVCQSLSCAMADAKGLTAALTEALGPDVRVQEVPCVGRCAKAPVAVVGQKPVERATPALVSALVMAGDTEDPRPDATLSLEGYLAQGGYRLLEACYQGERTPESVIQTLEHSGLRGLGGAGFPVGRKWRTVAEQPGPRLMAVNVDEGEPGTFKDRHYLERDPHRFVEGMLVAAWAVGIESIYLYVRDEYPACRRLLEEAVSQAAIRYPQAPPMELRRGAGAYVCGEESAMIESIEGKRGLPRLRPPFVAEVGLFGRPTLEHNLESLYWVRDMLERGPEWFLSHGRHGRKGLRSFSVSGRVKRPGVYLAPAGITLNELVSEYCGGMAQGHELYGYFPGGASGGILNAHQADIPLDFDTLQPHGCFIGSAAIVVFSQQDRARDLAQNAIAFFAEESCGQCTPCRLGCHRLDRMMAEPVWDAEPMAQLAQVMRDASICGLGQAAPNPARSVLANFPDEVGGQR
ncbi:NAD(P)H-dependent oxidoreductase subunit E [Ferrimonas balearica]|uniref:NAD(P)H-dependent oxidoreductase subunit E n=1 Tax=Ferrimonas balearica TaxID=44012 RepID=UPI001C99C7F1|nr:NAD(P)H-dependent oxidoreductase subunit E [Ferrimonas balearica]MBY5991025.1 NAD(P)H-dependent oxidoreductase subunit E [Ferrimonas balearica]